MSQISSNSSSISSYFLGCDVAKDKLDISLVDANGQELWADKVANESTVLVEYLLNLSGAYPDCKLTVVAEATACYHHNLVDAAEAIHMPCVVYNPLLTKQQTRATIRGKKTDRTDATMIARLGLRGEGQLQVPQPYRAVRYQARSAQKLGHFRIAFKLHTNHLDSVLDNGLSDELRQLMEGIQTAILEAREQLYADLADSAKGPVFDLLQTITGIGPYVAASLIGEIQDITRFTSTKALIAYSGLDPRIRQSGHTLNSTGRLTKRGSSYLRRSIFIAANVARRYDPGLKELYDKKRAEGKSYTVAVCIVARKLLAIVRAVWLNNTAYDKDYASNLTKNA